LKIGLPKIRFSRKMLLLTVGILALLGGTGAAALYAGADKLISRPEPKDNPAGAACDTVQTLVFKTPAQRLWMRRTIRMDHADGPTRIKTALRVAGLLANANEAVDLIQVSVLDRDGPTVRADMRGRAIGAEVVLAMQPQYLPDMKEPFIVRYYEGMPTDDGRYYGDRISLEVPEIRKLMGAMRNVADKADCTPLPVPDSAKAKPPGEHVVSTEGEKPDAHEAKPEDAESKTGDHAAPADDKADANDAASKEAPPQKQQSFLDSMLSLVGLGGSSNKPAEKSADPKAKPEHQASADTSAVSDDLPIPEIKDKPADQETH
jgi:hypothetical protein